RRCERLNDSTSLDLSIFGAVALSEPGGYLGVRPRGAGLSGICPWRSDGSGIIMALVGLTCGNCQNQFEIEAMPGQHVVRRPCPPGGQFVRARAAPADLPTGFGHRDNQQSGPYPLAQLQKMAAAGKLQPADMTWKEGMANWAEARTIPDLFAGNEQDLSLV